MHIIGVDCAVQDENTGLAHLRVHDNDVRWVQAKNGSRRHAADDQLVQWIRPIRARGEKVLLCLDAPLGWPAPFAEQLAAHQAGASLSDGPSRFFRRRTDDFVYDRLGKRPLDVASNLFARTAYRALGTIQALRKAFAEVELLWDISELQEIGFIEVYPAAWLRSEGLQDRDYKEKSGGRNAIVRELEQRTGFEPGLPEACMRSGHTLDAALCCLCGLDFVHGRCGQTSFLL